MVRAWDLKKICIGWTYSRRVGVWRCTSSWRYRGYVCRDRKTMIKILKTFSCCTGSQWSEWRIEVMWEDILVSVMSLAAEIWRCCRRRCFEGVVYDWFIWFDRAETINGMKWLKTQAITKSYTRNFIYGTKSVFLSRISKASVQTIVHRIKSGSHIQGGSKRTERHTSGNNGI